MENKLLNLIPHQLLLIAQVLLVQKKRGGPLAKYFDQCIEDEFWGEKTWEKAESKIIKLIYQDTKSGEKENMQKIKNAVSLFCAATLLVPSFAMADELPKVIDREMRHEITQAARQEYMANYDKIAKEMLPTVKVEEVKTQGIDVGRFQRLGAGEPYYVGHGAFVVPENEVRYVTADGKAAFKPRTIVEVPMAPVHGVVSGGRIIEKGTVMEIFDNPMHPYTIGLQKSKPRIDGNSNEPLFSIPGNVPNPVNMPSHCYFKNRCDKCIEKWDGKYPHMVQVSPTHFVSCYLADEYNKGGK
mgnify:CR=1 FL=1